jgi:hypothetical protein
MNSSSKVIHITPIERRAELALGGGYLDDVAWRWLRRAGSGVSRARDDVSPEPQRDPTRPPRSATG